MPEDADRSTTARPATQLAALEPPSDDGGDVSKASTQSPRIDKSVLSIGEVRRFTPDQPPRVVIYNKKLVNSYTAFRCEPTGCELVDERTVQEPAPLPRGYTGIEPNSRPAVQSEGIVTPAPPSSGQ